MRVPDTAEPLNRPAETLPDIRHDVGLPATFANVTAPTIDVWPVFQVKDILPFAGFVAPFDSVVQLPAFENLTASPAVALFTPLQPATFTPAAVTEATTFFLLPNLGSAGETEAVPVTVLQVV